MPWAKAGVGAVATQSIAEPSYGPKGLALMEQGIPADEVLKSLLAKDSGENVRQIGMVDANGNVGAHTGDRCIRYGDIRLENIILYKRILWKNQLYQMQCPKHLKTLKEILRNGC